MNENLIEELMEKVDKLSLTVTDLTKRVYDLESGSKNTGVYLEGAPEYVRDYITKDNEEGE